jgi:predicted nucleic acid-binding protein
MSLIRLFIDEDSMDQRFIKALRARGVDVITVAEVETISSSDKEQLLLATELQRVLYTFNVGDFCQLHSSYIEEKRSHAGIIISSQDYSIGEQMRRVLKLIVDKSAEDMINQLVFLSAYPDEI